MNGDIDGRIRLLLSVRHKLQAHLIFCNIFCRCQPEKTSLLTDAYTSRIQILLDGIEGLLLLVTEEERCILELHLVAGLKWEVVMEEYVKKWPSEISRVERTYKYRQQGALRKMKYYVEHYADTFDFSWLEDPLIDELAASDKEH